MKTAFFLSLLLVLTAPLHAADGLTPALQQGLYEEEVNRNLDKAIEAYRKAVADFDQNRQGAATAMFRLAESYRKQGRTNEAVMYYQRMIREFADQTQLAGLSRTNLAALGQVDGGNPGGRSLVAKLKSLPESELRLVLPTVVNDGLLNSLLAQAATMETRLVELRKDYADAHPEVVRATAALQNVNSQIDDKMRGILAGLELQLGDSRNGDGLNAATAPALSEEELEVRRWQELIKTSPDLLNSAGKDGLTPLQIAARDGRSQVAQFLVQSGADVNGGSILKALHYAAAGGHKAVVELLLSKGALVDGSSGDYYSPLHSAVAGDRRAVVEVLLAAKASVNARARTEYMQVYRGDTPLIVACRKGAKPIAELLLKSGASVNEENDAHNSPLGIAASRNNLELVSVLLQKGANPNLPGPWMPLEMVIESASVDAVKLLLEAGADPNASTDQGVPFLFKVIEKQGQSSDEIAAIMIKAGAKVDATAVLGTTQGKPVLASNDGRRTVRPLHYAAIMGRTNQVNLLLQNGADANARTSDGRSPLDLAAGTRNVGIVEALIAHGAKVNERNPEGTTPLWSATYSLPVAQALLKAGADPNVVDSSGRTLLDVLAGMVQNPADTRSVDMIALLKRFGALDDFPRWNQIRFVRGAEKPTVWKLGDAANSWNRFTAVELIVLLKPSFPDLAKVRVFRPQRDGGPSKVIPVNVQELIASGDRARDPWLESGDVVEIPELDHALNEFWEGFKGGDAEKFEEFLQRTVNFVCGGKTNQSQLVIGTAKPSIRGWTSDLVVDFRLLRTSSDLSRVTVRRMDPKTRAIAEIVIDGRAWVFPGAGMPAPVPVAMPQIMLPQATGIDNRPAPTRKDVWLRDGDVIEVPEKTER